MTTILDVRIPIAPVPNMLNRARLIALSMRALGGDYAAARFRVSIGADCEPFDLPATDIPDTIDEYVWTPRADFSRWRGTQCPNTANIVTSRFNGQTSADIVLMLDADVMPIAPFLPLGLKPPFAAGVPAHVTPFPGSNFHTWDNLLNAVGIRASRLAVPYSGFNIMETNLNNQLGPRGYWNTGVTFISGKAFNLLCAAYAEAVEFVRARMDSYFIDQTALTIALEEAQIPAHTLGIAFNFPNQDGFDRHYAKDLPQVKFIHFLRQAVVHREHDFQSLAAIKSLVAKTDLQGSNELLRQRIAAVLAYAGVA